MDRSSKKDDNFIKSIKWTVRPWMMKILVHKVDGIIQKKKKNSPWRMKILVQVDGMSKDEK